MKNNTKKFKFWKSIVDRWAVINGFNSLDVLKTIYCAGSKFTALKCHYSHCENVVLSLFSTKPRFLRTIYDEFPLYWTPWTVCIQSRCVFGGSGVHSGHGPLDCTCPSAAVAGGDALVVFKARTARRCALCCEVAVNCGVAGNGNVLRRTSLTLISPACLWVSRDTATSLRHRQHPYRCCPASLTRTYWKALIDRLSALLSCGVHRVSFIVDRYAGCLSFTVHHSHCTLWKITQNNL